MKKFYIKLMYETIDDFNKKNSKHILCSYYGKSPRIFLEGTPNIYLFSGTEKQCIDFINGLYNYIYQLNKITEIIV